MTMSEMTSVSEVRAEMMWVSEVWVVWDCSKEVTKEIVMSLEPSRRSGVIERRCDENVRGTCSTDGDRWMTTGSHLLFRRSGP